VKVLVTGAEGFIAKQLLVSRLYNFIPVSRRGEGKGGIAIGDMLEFSGWRELFSGVDVVVHLAARVHHMDDENPEAYRGVNTDVVRRMAEAAVIARVKRFIFISTVKVNGEGTQEGRQYLPCDVPSPKDPYSVSKYEAEQCLLEIAKKTQMEVVIIRPPLIYGEGVKGNFNNLLKLAKSGLPLPFGAIENRRSMIYLGNMTDFIIRCIDHPKAVNQIFLVSDGYDLSINRLIKELRLAMDKPIRLLSVPMWVFTLVGRLTGKSVVVDRLCGSLQVDGIKTNALLGWTPPYTVRQGLQLTVSAFLKNK
jgi:nucleoside-diphosphate-sugar epimerase